jgi:hypothetical protein
MPARSQLAPSSRRQLIEQFFVRSGHGKGKELWGKRPLDTEVQVVDPIGGGDPVTEGGAKALWIVAPGTAADHPAISVRAGRCPGRTISRCPLIRIVPTVLNPVVDIAMDLIEIPRICLKAGHGQCPLSILTLGASGDGVVAIVVRLLRRD